MDWQPFNMFQSKKFAEIYSKYRNTELCEIKGNNGFIFRFPILGCLKLRFYLQNTTDVEGFLEDALRVCSVKGIPQLEVVTSLGNNNFQGYSYKVDGTYVIDLSSNIEDILKKVQKRTRETIRQAKRKGVKIRETRDIKDFEEWWALYMSTGKRGNFLTQQHDFVEEVFKNEDISRLFIATMKGKIVGGALLILNDYPLYWLGGSHEQFWKFKPNQLLHWEIIEWSKKRNYLFYDMGGAIKEDKTGPSHFKKHFGGDFRNIFIYCKDLNPLKSRLIDWGIKLKYKLIQNV